MPNRTATDSQQKTTIESTGRSERVIGDLVLAEVFFVQASIESASALGDGIAELRQRLGADEEEREQAGPISELMRQTRDRVLEPYATRFTHFRKLVKDDLGVLSGRFPPPAQDLPWASNAAICSGVASVWYFAFHSA